MPFNIRVLDMEQGDCTLVRCPNGALVMVDCGSKSGFSDDRRITAQMSVREWTKSHAGTIDALILTHPDKDHYSEVWGVLGDWTWTDDVDVGNITIPAQAFSAIKVSKIYFSGASTVSGPLGNYRVNSVGSHVYQHHLQTLEIHEVTINTPGGPNQYRTWNKADGFTNPNPATPTAINNNSLPVLSGSTWSVSIIAGNVGGSDISKESIRNTASLITLLESGTKRGLICGDGTKDTEAFLTTNHAASISNLDFIQVGHHGSETSSDAPFVTMANPKAAYVSVANMEHKHFLPKSDVIGRWKKKLGDKAQIDAHTIDYWVRDPNFRPGRVNKASQLLDTWVSDGTRFVQRDNLYFLDEDETDYETFSNDYFALDPVRGFRLYREETQLSIKETATNAGFDFTFG